MWRQMRRSTRCSVKMTRETKCPEHPFSLKVPRSAHPLWPEKFLLSSWWKEGMRGKWEKECERILPKWGIICHHSLGGFWYLINSYQAKVRAGKVARRGRKAQSSKSTLGMKWVSATYMQRMGKEPYSERIFIWGYHGTPTTCLPYSLLNTLLR